jgi:hypothetical protein
MALEDDLFALEQQFWPGNADFYRQHLDDKCVVAFTEMAGVMDREQIAAMTKDGQRWRDLRLTRKGFLAPTKDVALLTYEMAATRENGTPYKALVSSAYALRGGEWKMAFHQQTPLPS